MVLIQRVFVVCGRVARAVADSYRRVAHRPASTDDLTVESRGDVDRRRRPRSRGSFGALTLILQQVKRPSTNTHPGMRFEGALPKRREVVPRSFGKDAEGKRLLCGDFSRPPPRPSRSRLRRRRVCVCVLQRRRRAFVDSFPTHPSNIFESVRVARGGRSPSGTQSQVCDFTGGYMRP